MTMMLVCSAEVPFTCKRNDPATGCRVDVTQLYTRLRRRRNTSALSYFSRGKVGIGLSVEVTAPMLCVWWRTLLFCRVRAFLIFVFLVHPRR